MKQRLSNRGEKMHVCWQAHSATKTESYHIFECHCKFEPVKCKHVAIMSAVSSTKSQVPNASTDEIGVRMANRGGNALIAATLTDKPLIICENSPVTGEIVKAVDADIASGFPVMYFKKLDAAATKPERKTAGAAGYDLASIEQITIKAGKNAKIKTGISIEMPEDIPIYGKLESRSSLASKQITVEGGVIDRDYRGEIIVILENRSGVDYEVKKGERVAQLILKLHATYTFKEKETELQATARKGGFGSTGK
jgi:dUTP pyrophosphatase